MSDDTPSARAAEASHGAAADPLIRVTDLRKVFPLSLIHI